MPHRLLLLLLFLAPITILFAQHDLFPVEKLGRGLVVLPAQEGGRFLSWRFLRNDTPLTTFDIVRDQHLIATHLSSTSCYVDPDGQPDSNYKLVTHTPGLSTETDTAIQTWNQPYTRITLCRPTDRHTPNDCSVGDVDGDGEYELFVKWMPRNAKDNSHHGRTDRVFIDCYRWDGTLLWRIDLGANIRAGAHYTQFLVYDFDGDGLSELICKTAPGSTDGQGNYVTLAATDSTIQQVDNSIDHRNPTGYILHGEELLTVFDGRTGLALHTVYYQPNRAGSIGGAPAGLDPQFWGDDYGNRCDRYLACVAHLSGADISPSAVLCRGYYTKAYVWAVDWDGRQLTTRWLHASLSPTQILLTDNKGRTHHSIHHSSTSGSGSCTLFGNGNHNLSVADVDGDGCDEIIYGSAALDHDGRLLYATGFGHGDAIHLANHIPDRSGLEVFQVHENRGCYSWDLHDAATGVILHRGGNDGVDNGRGLAADVLDNVRGNEFWSADDLTVRSAVSGEVVSAARPSINFRIYWDGDLLDELLDNRRIQKVLGDGTVSTLISLSDYGNSVDCNGTKHTPCLQADLFGDWREEVILYDSSDGSTLNIFSTNIPTPHRLVTPMHDHVYRMGVAWQNSGYNQPPHLGYYPR